MTRGVAQAQQQVGNIMHQQSEERRREQVGVPGSQPNERGHAGMSYIYRGHSGYGSVGLGRKGSGRAQPLIQQSQSGGKLPPLALISLWNKELGNLVKDHLLQHADDLDFVQEVLSATGEIWYLTQF